MNRNRIAAAALAATAATTIALGAAPAANADNSQDIEFLQLLETHNIQANPLGMLWAHEICANIDAGSTPVSQVGEVYRRTERNFTLDMSVWFVAASIVEYCPWNTPAGSGAPVAQVPVGEQIA